MRPVLLTIAVFLLQPSRPESLGVRVGVFGLFHPTALTLSAADEVVSVRGDRDGCVLRNREEARVDMDGGSLSVTCAGETFRTTVIHAIGAAGDATDFDLSVPGRIARRYHGRLDVNALGDALAPVVTMDLETAVASVVGAEQIMAAPGEALKAQAVAARSFFVASRHRHRGFDFCDTTHCQFLREPPADDRPAARAARDTAGLVLAYRGSPIAAFYSASCGGRTRTLVEAGLDGGEGYPYFSVECEAAKGVQGDGGRRGHGVGLCQEGAAVMAAGGRASFAEILRHYYPETTVMALR